MWLESAVLGLAMSMTPPYSTGISTQVAEVMVKEAVGKLYSNASTDREEGKQALLSAARESTETRDQIVKALVEVLENPQAQPTKNFAAWRAAAELVGELKATSAIDILVAHLDDNDGVVGLSLSPFPAVQAIIRIGEPAVPELVRALSSARSAVRLNAARALGEIGGSLSHEALQRRLQTEMDPEVRFYILAALSRPALPFTRN